MWLLDVRAGLIGMSSALITVLLATEPRLDLWWYGSEDYQRWREQSRQCAQCVSLDFPCGERCAAVTYVSSAEMEEMLRAG